MSPLYAQVLLLSIDLCVCLCVSMYSSAEKV